MNSADLICYVIEPSESEEKPATRQRMRLGTNNPQEDDYNRIHFASKFVHKSIDVTFQKQKTSFSHSKNIPLLALPTQQAELDVLLIANDLKMPSLSKTELKETLDSTLFKHNIFRKAKYWMESALFYCLFELNCAARMCKKKSVNEKTGYSLSYFKYDWVIEADEEETTSGSSSGFTNSPTLSATSKTTLSETYVSSDTDQLSSNESKQLLKK
jgi:hypothetical protein